MKSNYELSKEYQDKFNEYIRCNSIINTTKPDYFVDIMKCNKGIVNFMMIDNEEYLELRNPLVAVLGDSVTGAHFEMVDLQVGVIAQDLKDGYVEKFKHLLHDKYAYTTPSIINSGIAGDNVHGMLKRLKRDVINYNPDLVIINATLNWSCNRGSVNVYKYNLEEILRRIKKETSADIILMTPNGAIKTDTDQSLEERVKIVRELSNKYQTSLVDIYKMWQEVVAERDVRETLSNQKNHPTPLGHTFMAKAIMQLFN